MAISFEQAQPMDASAAATYGQRQAMMQDRDFALKAFETQSQAAARQRQLDISEGQLGQSAYQFEAGRNPSNRDIWHQDAADAEHQATRDQQLEMFNQRSQLDREHQTRQIEATFDMQGRQFTNSDNLRLQQLRNNQSTVDGMVDAGLIDRTQAEAFRQMTTDRIAPLEILRQMDDRKRQEAQLRQMTAQTAATDALTHQREQFRQRIADGTYRQLPDPLNPGEMLPGYFQIDRNGQWTPVQGSDGMMGAGGGSHRGGGGAGGGAPAPGLSPHDDLRIRNDVEKELEARLALPAPAGGRVDPRYIPPDSPIRTPEGRTQHVISEMNRMRTQLEEASLDAPVMPHPAALPRIRDTERGIAGILAEINKPVPPEVAAADAIFGTLGIQPDQQRQRDREALERIRRRMVHIVSRYPAAQNGMAPQSTRDHASRMEAELLQIRNRYMPAPSTTAWAVPGFDGSPMPNG